MFFYTPRTVPDRASSIGPDEVHVVVAGRDKVRPAVLIHLQLPDAVTTIVRADGDRPGRGVVVVPFVTFEVKTTEMENVLKRQRL